MNVGVGLGVDKQILNVCKLGTFIVGNHCVRCLELSFFVHHPFRFNHPFLDPL